MTSAYCPKCGRANSATAKRCLWCGVPIDAGMTLPISETTGVDIGYLDGIDKFEDAVTVRLIINANGIEIADLIPGTRSVKIPASQILEANFVDASTMIKGKRVRPRWWWLALGPAALLIPGRRTPNTRAHDYILTIKYKTGERVRNAVFHREDRAGRAVIEGLARIVTSLAKHNRVGKTS